MTTIGYEKNKESIVNMETNIDVIMMTQYIYLLQEREFIKTKENIYKVGMTTKEKHTRFNQYPKGSVLLFQMICNNCKNIEKQVIKLLKEKCKLRKDIGNEYFEGNYKSMIDIIYFTIKNEKEECLNNKETEHYPCDVIKMEINLDILTEYIRKELEDKSQYEYTIPNISTIDKIRVKVKIVKGFNDEYMMVINHCDSISGADSGYPQAYSTCFRKHLSKELLKEFFDIINKLYYSKFSGKFYTDKNEEKKYIDHIKIKDSIPDLLTGKRIKTYGKLIDLCSICLEETLIKTECSHHLCYPCKHQMDLNDNGDRICPLCESELDLY